MTLNRLGRARTPSSGARPAGGHQTVRLTAGAHASPAEGVCVLELASMLAGEPFSDHPSSVCPVLGGFLRAYNDRIDDARRQDLYAYAAKLVGSRRSAEAERARARALAPWIRGRPRTRWRGRLRLGSRRLHLCSREQERRVGAASYVFGPVSDETHARVLGLLDELLALDGQWQDDSVLDLRSSREQP